MNGNGHPINASMMMMLVRRCDSVKDPTDVLASSWILVDVEDPERHEPYERHQDITPAWLKCIRSAKGRQSNSLEQQGKRLSRSDP